MVKLAVAMIAAALTLGACSAYDTRGGGNLNDLTLAPGLPNPAFSAQCTAPCSAMPGRGCC